MILTWPDLASSGPLCVCVCVCVCVHMPMPMPMYMCDNFFVQAIPIIRGDGVYQKAVDYCITLLNEGAWIHLFPEGYSFVCLIINL